MKITYRLTQKRWEAIQNNNTQFDGDFYGVTTTKIFVVLRALPVPNKNHVLIFKTAQEALTLGFRPCKDVNQPGKSFLTRNGLLKLSNLLIGIQRNH